ncbi:MAG: hypothetical protein IJ042_03345 [Butyricicoccus sp.]|nr:hypothetical protein [Butyricicoccus sp.]
MPKPKPIRGIDRSEAIARELEQYGADLQQGVTAAARTAGRRLVRLTKATAPVGAREKYKRAITMTEESTQVSCRIIWHVKPPEHRLTHLLVHGHATKDGGRTKSNPFLQNALDQVLPKYEKDVRKVIQKGGGKS